MIKEGHSLNDVWSENFARSWLPLLLYPRLWERYWAYCGYLGGRLDSFIMRCRRTPTFPAILIALLIDGIVGSLLPKAAYNELKLYVLVLAIAASQWVNFARTVRGSTLVEKNKEYVQAAKVIGVHPFWIMVRHVLPNVVSPVLVIATLSLALAILTEATLSFWVGHQPSLGTLIRIGQQYLFSGEWWMTIFRSALVILVLAVNLLVIGCVMPLIQSYVDEHSLESGLL